MGSLEPSSKFNLEYLVDWWLGPSARESLGGSNLTGGPRYCETVSMIKYCASVTFHNTLCHIYLILFLSKVRLFERTGTQRGRDIQFDARLLR